MKKEALQEGSAYHNAQMIRAFADAYYEKYSTLFSGNPRLKEYYDWLQKRADWLDPLVENDYDQFLTPQ